MAELAPISWVLSPIMNIVLDRAKLYLRNQYNWNKDMQNNIEMLENTLSGIQIIVDAAEKMQSKNCGHEQLLYQLKDAIYEADDLLDEFDYWILETQAMENRGWLSRETYSPIKFAKRLIRQEKLLNRSKELLNKLDRIRKNAKALNVQAAGCEKSNAIQLHETNTTSILSQQTFGRAKVKEELINLLLNEPESSHTNIHVIAIVGDGGIGKTTLAQLIYNEQKIIEKFEKRIWICVSNDFDKIIITRKILERASTSNRQYKQDMDLNYLQGELQNELQSEEFLLVLDDVWINEQNDKYWNLEMWKTLLAPLQKGQKGSKILVTTRMRMVVEMFNAKSSMISLEGLTNNETWSLLEKCAFDDETSNKHPELQKIGMQIAKRLRGSPLAAKVVGAMLKGSLDVEYWREISKRKIYDSIMSILGSSYQCLPNHLKQCFAYCSIFPKDWNFAPEKLVSLWIAQGYVLQDRTERSLRDIGMDYFNQLLSRSLFEKVEPDYVLFEKVEPDYVMHDLIHDLAQYVSRDECFRIDGGKQEKILETIRHLGIVVNCAGELQAILTRLEKMSNLKNLRTLMLFNNSWEGCNDLPLGILQELKSLRVLDFGTLGALQFPKTLCHYLHLRYLNLGKEFSGILPKSLYRLYHLQVLSAGRLPLSESIFRLLKFGELQLAAHTLEFKVERKRCLGIGVLKNMGMETVVEGKLCIMNLENVTDKAEAAEADLGTKQYLNGLKLHWDSFSTRINGHDADQEVAEALKPHPNLKRLKIKGFRGRRCPSWLESKWLDNLQSLSLINCSDLEVLPPLDHLPLLKNCKVYKCPKLMPFPRFPPTLERIEITETGSISELRLRPRWSSSTSEGFELRTTGISSHTALLHDHHLQAIQDLHIDDCKEPMPAKWLLRLATLKDLFIDSCQEWLMSDEEADGVGVLPSSLESLHISKCPVTEKWLSRCLQGLTSLKNLILFCCSELKSLPQEDGGGVLATSLESLEILLCPVTDLSLISHCTSLKKLKIEQCHELKSLLKEDGSGVLPSSLESLHIMGCPLTDLSLISHCTSLKKLKIQSCHELKSLLKKDGSGVLPSLKSLDIKDCSVTDLSLISHCTSLKKLYIERCHELKSLLKEDGSGILPSSLESLDIIDCSVIDLTSISHCISLKELKIKKCHKLKSLPQVGLPKSLEKVGFGGCDDPEESVVRCLQGLPSLSRLTVDFWTDLTALTSLPHLRIEDCRCEPNSKVKLPESLQSLQICDCNVSDMGLSTCLQGLTSLSKLEIGFCNELTSLPSAQVLHRLTTLEELYIFFCKELTSLGALHVLASLKSLTVRYCLKLKPLPKKGLPSSIELLRLD